MAEWDPAMEAQVVVVGAGPAGSSTAAGLAQRGLDVLLLDKAAFPREKTCGDGLTPRAVAVLQEMGLLPQLEAAGARRIQGARIYAPSGRFIEVRFDELDGSLPDFGLTLPRETLDALLLRHARESGVRFVGRCRATGLVWKDGVVAGISAILDGAPIAISAPLTCLATGASMPLVQEVGLLPTVPRIMRAARAYFDGAHGLDPFFQLHFDRRLIPGYGWIFPMQGGRANVGAGYFPAGKFRRRPVPPRKLYDRFVGLNPEVQRQLTGARPDGLVKSCPLRTDFLTVQTERDGLLLVGEAAGLVNPINGEGVDFALESGMLAAEVAAKAATAGDCTRAGLAGYGRGLRERYGSFFFYLTRMRRWYIREGVLNVIVRKAQRRESLRNLFVKAALGLIDPREGVSWRTLRDILW